MAWCVIVKREPVINALSESNIKISDGMDDEALLKIVIDIALSDEAVNYKIWKIAKTNPHIKYCHGCEHLHEKD